MPAPERDADRHHEALLRHDGYIRWLALSLVDDPHRADDVAQQTWVAALTHRPHGSLRAWLATVTRRFASRVRRGEERRTRHERAAARDAEAASDREIREREAARHAVVEAVLALAEPYRTTLVLRFLDALPPRKVAARMGVPVETVRTRIKRGLEQMRSRLDREHHGDRAAWCVALLPLGKAAPLPPLGPVRTVLSRVASTSMKTKLLVAAISFAALSPTFWKHLLVPSAPEPSTGSVRRDEAEAAPGSGPATMAAARARREAVPAAQSATGSLVVQVVWADDRKPAANLSLRVCPLEVEERMFAERDAVTDALGTARLDDLPPGVAAVWLDRGLEKEARVMAGQECKIELEVPAGITLEGCVVDAQNAPIAEATIVLSDARRPDSLAQVVARTGMDGTFRLRGVQPGSELEARAPDRAPSQRHVPKGATMAPEPMRIVLDAAGGSIAGLVRDPDGKPVANAIVQVGASRVRLPGGAATTPRARTDAGGRFQFAGVGAGKQKLLARAAGFAPSTSEVTVVAAQQCAASVDLVAGVTLEGTVTNASAEPVANASVRLPVTPSQQQPVPESLLSHGTRTRADGTYTLRGLTAGTIDVVVEGPARGPQRGAGDAKTQIVARAGERVRWDPRLGEGLTIRGRVVDERAAGVAGAEVRRGMTATGGPFTTLAITDAEGRFVLYNCPDGPTRLEVCPSRGDLVASAALDGVRPGPTEVLITLRESDRPSIVVTGTVLGADGRPVLGVRVSAIPLLIDCSEYAAPQAGSFRVGPLPAGWCAVRIDSPGYAPLLLPFRDVPARETWDVGEVRLQKPGSLRVAARRRDNGAIAEAWFFVGSAASQVGSAARIRDGSGRDPELAPGHVLDARAEGCASVCVPFTVTSGVETVVEVVLDPGVAHTLSFQLPERTTARALHAVVRDGGDRVVADQWIWSRGAPREWRLGLAAGTYRVEASTPNGWKGGASFEVPAAGTATPTSVALR